LDFESFITSLDSKDPPINLSDNLLALWYDAKSNWSKAHEIVQELENKEAAWIHAYLHRKEGDDWNAGYWYRRAGKDMCTTTLEIEWNDLLAYFLNESTR
jgi:hypothetical protein